MPTREYAAFLRAVSPENAKMAELKQCFERTGFTDVRTLLSSGNVVFGSRAGSGSSLERKIEAGMQVHLGRSFLTIVRSVEHLREMLESDPYRRFRLVPGVKRVVTFLRKPPESKVRLPPPYHGARILCLRGSEVFSVYVPGPKGPAFMSLIERTFGREVTTRTWDTVTKVAGLWEPRKRLPGA